MVWHKNHKSLIIEKNIKDNMGVMCSDAMRTHECSILEIVRGKAPTIPKLYK